jgi:nicotinamidase-related amidase
LHHGFKTVLLSDAVSSFDPELHAATLRNFAMKFGMVMDSGRFLSLL